MGSCRPLVTAAVDRWTDIFNSYSAIGWPFSAASGRLSAQASIWCRCWLAAAGFEARTVHGWLLKAQRLPLAGQTPACKRKLHGQFSKIPHIHCRPKRCSGPAANGQYNPPRRLLNQQERLISATVIPNCLIQPVTHPRC